VTFRSGPAREIRPPTTQSQSIKKLHSMMRLPLSHVRSAASQGFGRRGVDEPVQHAGLIGPRFIQLHRGHRDARLRWLRSDPKDSFGCGGGGFRVGDPSGPDGVGQG
jgi:hypothetical protein